MANTRFNYDKCRTLKILQESTGPGRYSLNKPGPGCNPCFVEDPHIRLQQIGPNLRNVQNGSFTDINSDLKGLTRHASKDCYDYKSYAVKSTKRNFPDCKVDYTDESRTTHPAWMYRDLEQSRRHPLVFDPQANTVMPVPMYVNSTNIARDHFVARKPCPLNETFKQN